MIVYEWIANFYVISNFYEGCRINGTCIVNLFRLLKIMTQLGTFYILSHVMYMIVAAAVLYLYGCYMDIRGIEQAATIEKMQTRCLKHLPNVPMDTANYLVRYETGRIKLESVIIERSHKDQKHKDQNIS